MGYGDGSGGEHSADERYCRCGWGRVLLAVSETAATQVVGARFGPVPGDRQTNNRAELFSLLSFLRATEGAVDFWTDSEVTCIGWAARKEETSGTGCLNGGLWRKVGEATQERGGGRDIARVFHLNIHRSAQEADEKGVPRRIWTGNKAADECADAGARKHTIDDTQMARY